MYCCPMCSLFLFFLYIDITFCNEVVNYSCRRSRRIKSINKAKLLKVFSAPGQHMKRKIHSVLMRQVLVSTHLQAKRSESTSQLFFSVSTVMPFDKLLHFGLTSATRNKVEEAMKLPSGHLF